MSEIDSMGKHSGRYLKEDDTEYNIADLLSDIDLTNLSNNKRAIRVDTQSVEDTHTEIITSDETGYDLITPSTGNQIIVHDVFLIANANMGEVALDFSGGDPIARLYTDRFSRSCFTNLTIEGGKDGRVQFTGDGSAEGEEVFVLINYVEIEA